MQSKNDTPKRCSEPGYESLEDAIKIIIGAEPRKPPPPHLRAEFLRLLALTQRARESKSWPVKNYVTNPHFQKICCVHMDHFRRWAQCQDTVDNETIEFELSKLHSLATKKFSSLNKEEPSSTDYIQCLLDLVEDELGADIELGKQIHKLRSDSGKRHAKELRDKREPEWKKWRAEAERLKKRYSHLARSKTKLARRIKKNLRLTESVETIRKRI